MKLEVWKEGKQVTREVEVGKIVDLPQVEEMPGISEMTLYYFPKINLVPAIVFQHMSGIGLSHWLDHTELRIHGQDAEPFVQDLRYVHGRSEVMRGTPSVSVVLLAKPVFSEEISEDRWLTYMPSIYKRFSIFK